MEHRFLSMINNNIINGDMQETVDARKLHSELQVKTQFSKWIQRRLDDSQMVEDKDFVVLSKIDYNLKGGAPSKEYFLSFDTAKHVCMMEKTDMGKAIRQMFIDREKQLRKETKHEIPTTREEVAVKALKSNIEVGELFQVPRHIIEVEAVKYVEENIGVNFGNLLAHSPAQKQIEDEEIMLEPSVIGERLGITGSIIQRGKKINEFLAYINYQEKINKEWVPTKLGQSYCIKHQWRKGTKRGYNLLWNYNEIKQQWEYVNN